MSMIKRTSIGITGLELWTKRRSFNIGDLFDVHYHPLPVTNNFWMSKPYKEGRQPTRFEMRATGRLALEPLYELFINDDISLDEKAKKIYLAYGRYAYLDTKELKDMVMRGYLQFDAIISIEFNYAGCRDKGQRVKRRQRAYHAMVEREDPQELLDKLVASANNVLKKLIDGHNEQTARRWIGTFSNAGHMVPKIDNHLQAKNEQEWVGLARDLSEIEAINKTIAEFEARREFLGQRVKLARVAALTDWAGELFDAAPESWMEALVRDTKDGEVYNPVPKGFAFFR